jgi:hypothetical protein
MAEPSRSSSRRGPAGLEPQYMRGRRQPRPIPLRSRPPARRAKLTHTIRAVSQLLRAHRHRRRRRALQRRAAPWATARQLHRTRWRCRGFGRSSARHGAIADRAPEDSFGMPSPARFATRSTRSIHRRAATTSLPRGPTQPGCQDDAPRSPHLQRSESLSGRSTGAFGPSGPTRPPGPGAAGCGSAGSSDEAVRSQDNRAPRVASTSPDRRGHARSRADSRMTTRRTTTTPAEARSPRRRGARATPP